MIKDTVWFCEQMMGMRLLPYQRLLLKMMDKWKAVRVFRARACDTHNLQWMAEVATKMMILTRNNEGGNELERNIAREYIEDIYRGAKEVFCNGIYVKSKYHPCGWDFISLDDLDSVADAFEKPVGIYTISGGNYGSHDFEEMTLEDIISTVGIHGWCFEISGVDELR